MKRALFETNRRRKIQKAHNEKNNIVPTTIQKNISAFEYSTQGKDSVARLSASTSGNISFGAKDPEEAYGKLIPQLFYANTADFRSYYETRRVK